MTHSEFQCILCQILSLFSDLLNGMLAWLLKHLHGVLVTSLTACFLVLFNKVCVLKTFNRKSVSL